MRVNYDKRINISRSCPNIDIRTRLCPKGPSELPRIHENNVVRRTEYPLENSQSAKCKPANIYRQEQTVYTLACSTRTTRRAFLFVRSRLAEVTRDRVPLRWSSPFFSLIATIRHPPTRGNSVLGISRILETFHVLGSWIRAKKFCWKRLSPRRSVDSWTTKIVARDRSFPFSWMKTRGSRFSDGKWKGEIAFRRIVGK